jgi:hypothetical protein
MGRVCIDWLTILEIHQFAPAVEEQYVPSADIAVNVS